MEVRTDLDRTVAGVDDFNFGPPAASVESSMLAFGGGDRTGLSVSAGAPGCGRIGSWTVTSLVPSGNTHSTCMMCIMAAMPDITSLVERTVDPIRRSDRRHERPSRAPSSISSVMMATASGWFSFNPLARRRLASSAAVKIVRRSSSVGVSSMRIPQLANRRKCARAWRAAAISSQGMKLSIVRVGNHRRGQFQRSSSAQPRGPSALLVRRSRQAASLPQ